MSPNLIIQKTYSMMCLLNLDLNLFVASQSHPEQLMVVAWLEHQGGQRPETDGFKQNRNVSDGGAKSEMYREDSFLQPVVEIIKLWDQ